MEPEAIDLQVEVKVTEDLSTEVEITPGESILALSVDESLAIEDSASGSAV